MLEHKNLNDLLFKSLVNYDFDFYIGSFFFLLLFLLFSSFLSFFFFFYFFFSFFSFLF